MENGLLDRVEGNANVHRWSEQTQLGKGDSITVGYMSELSDYTRISVTQNNLQELKVDENLLRALAQFWNPAYSCFTFEEVDLVLLWRSTQPYFGVLDFSVIGFILELFVSQPLVRS
ncbi:hypothetical protein CXB51_002863 [Gossypium anomalum]|uniref:Aminotransferase-like plant mobile domain-containing protein n=1 Tax=Gossypium anomalum TaxID=47600 RepID=A0A8J5ZGG7_9ROSI|nr:hypothetical protein CXB51_002863 [Gossypium anomalum]